MSAVMWRWASEYAGFPALSVHLEANDFGIGDGGRPNGDGTGDGTSPQIEDEVQSDTDEFNFRTGEWRFQ